MQWRERLWKLIPVSTYCSVEFFVEREPRTQAEGSRILVDRIDMSHTWPSSHFTAKFDDIVVIEGVAFVGYDPVVIHVCSVH